MLEQIVRALAAIDPRTDLDVGDFCQLCDRHVTDYRNTAQHAPRCAYAQAVEWVAANPA